MVKKSIQQEEQQGIQLKEFSIALGQIAEEKGISQDRVIETVEAALSAAYKKDYGKRGQHIRAEFDPEMGEAKFFLVKEVVDDTVRIFVEESEESEEDADVEKKEEKEAVQEAQTEQHTQGKEDENGEEEKRLPRFNPEKDITLEDALMVKKNVSVGDVLEEELESHDTFGRVAAQTAKQVIIQKIREAERESMFAEFKEREGEVISGTVERLEGRNVYVTMGRSTGVIFPQEQSQNDRYRIGQRVKVYVVRVDSDPRSPGIILSRADKELVAKLFALEVPEIFSGTVEIKGVAREAGVRTKIAVAATEEGVDPVGSCVGQKGTRVQAVIDEIGGEKIDIIEWNEDVKQYIRAAISPAKVMRIDLNEESRVATLVVGDDQLSLAIGRQGQNVRLASHLTEWQIDVVSELEAGEDKENKEEDTPNTPEQGDEENKKEKQSERDTAKEEQDGEKREEITKKAKEETLPQDASEEKSEDEKK